MKTNFLLIVILSCIFQCNIKAQKIFEEKIVKNIDVFYNKYNDYEYNDYDVKNLKNQTTINAKYFSIGTNSYTINENQRKTYQFLNKLDIDKQYKLLLIAEFLRTENKNLIQFNKHYNDLIFLPIAISALEENYNNTAFVYGIWGLKYITAISYGLTIDSCYDERLDIKKSSYVAMKYLDILYNKYNNWQYAIYAYISNPTLIDNYICDTLNTNIKEHKEVFDNFIGISQWINDNKNKINYKKMSKNQDFDTVKLKNRLHFGQISEFLEINIDSLKQINPLYIGNVIDGRRFEKQIIIPKKYTSQFVSSIDIIEKYKDSIYFKIITSPVTKFKEQETKSTTNYLIDNSYEELQYKIVSGDNLGSIANKFNVSIANLKEWNDISGTNIYAGQTLSIFVKKTDNIQKPVSNKAITPKSTLITQKTFDSSKYVLHETYTIKKGDSLYKLAQNYSWTSVEDLMLWNNIEDPSKLKLGQIIKVYKKK